VLHQRYVPIKKEADFASAQFHISQQLRLMDWQDGFDRFILHNNQLVYQSINPGSLGIAVIEPFLYTDFTGANRFSRIFLKVFPQEYLKSVLSVY
jgi:hypothetical protein